MSIIRAKIQISGSFPYSKDSIGENEQVTAHAVYGGSSNAEDNTFAAATPSLYLTMQINNPTAVGKLIPGKKYYIDFTEALE